MLVIREEQLEAFRDAARQKFAAEFLLWLRAHHPARIAVLSDEEALRRIAVGVERAKDYGLRQGSAIRIFVSLMFLVAPNFDEQPDIRAVLTDPRLAPDARPRALSSLTTAQQWAEAARAADAAVWNGTL